MSRILKNTTGSSISFPSTGITIVAGGSYTIPSADLMLWADSDLLITYVGSGAIVVNDGTADLSPSTGLDLIKIVWPRTMTVVLNDPLHPDFYATIDKSTDGLTRLSVESSPADNHDIDGIGRQRVSLLKTTAAATMVWSDQPFVFLTQTGSGGTATHLIQRSNVAMTVPTTSGAFVIRQTRRYFRYIVGRSYKSSFAGIFGSPKTNVNQRLGIFDDNDGWFIEYQGTALNLVQRSSVGGSIVETRVPRSAWNVDKMDGTGKSGVNLDPTKHNAYVVDYTWHGSGRVRFGMICGGVILYFHHLLNANVNNDVSIRSPILPIRYEIRNTGTTASSTTMYQGAFSHNSESQDQDDDQFAIGYSASRGVSNAVLQSTVLPLLSIQPKLTFGGLPNRIPILPRDVSVISATNIVYYQLILNPTLVGASWTSVSSRSAVEYDRSATSFSGGEIISEGYVDGKGGSAQRISAIANEVFIGLNIPGTSADILSLVGRSTGGGTDTYATFSWQEFQ